MVILVMWVFEDERNIVGRVGLLRYVRLDLVGFFGLRMRLLYYLKG